MVPFESVGTGYYSHCIDKAIYWPKIAIFIFPAFDALATGVCRNS